MRKCGPCSIAGGSVSWEVDDVVDDGWSEMLGCRVNEEPEIDMSSGGVDVEAGVEVRDGIAVTSAVKRVGLL